MPYVPQQVPGNLVDFDALRKWVEEEFQRLGRAYADDELLGDTNLGAVEADVATLQTDVGTLQTDVATIQAQIIKADDIVSASGGGALTSTVAAQIASINVPIGTWDITAFLQFSGAGGTNTTNVRGSIDPTTATLNTTLPDSGHFRNIAGIGDLFFPMPLGPKRVVLGAATNYFLNASATFTLSTYSVNGIIVARRIVT
jgi:hypothetical protein